MKNTIYLSSLFFTLILMIGTGRAEVRPNSMISDGMVLQQHSEIVLWGTSSNSRTITIQASWGETCSCTPDPSGKWKITIQTPAATFTPQTLSFDDGDITLVKNILIGEVWLASGQSNMDMPLGGYYGCAITGGPEEILSSSDYPMIRMFKVPRKPNRQPVADCNGTWCQPTIENSPYFSAAAWYFAKYLYQGLHVPIGIINCAFPGSSVEGWSNEELLDKYADQTEKMDALGEKWVDNSPLVMYNGLLHPILGYVMRGVIWYQGCANVGNYHSYTIRFSQMVELWRRKFNNPKMPFYYTEIAPFSYDGPDRTSSAYLREAQFAAQQLIPESAMICTNDLVQEDEIYNIHPSDKKNVGLRLAQQALNKTYGKHTIYCKYPLYDSWRCEGKEARVSFKNIDLGICRQTGFKGFELAGEDRVFYPADESRWDWSTHEIVITADQVRKPVAVRYCFKNFQIGNVFGGAGLPLIPFRTDDWD